ncbi:MAG TPA: ArgE/DapE family deacylase [Thermomicrobiales bacterium]|nr:ArgE/DapE family deacylase [Thermomicrobiales bacterium]
MATQTRPDEARAALFEAIDQRTDELIETVAELVRRPSELGHESLVQEYVAGHLRGSDAEVEVWELDESVKHEPNAGNSGVPFAGRPNVTGKIAGAGGGKSMIFNGHIDVVSPEPVDQWTYDPWGAHIAGDKMFGRGAYDMKSGVAANLFLPRLLRDLGIQLNGDLTIHSVIEEECTGNGTLAASLRDRADAALVTESVGRRALTGHLGVIWFRVRIQGRSAHAGWASQGVNAIVKAMPIVQALHQLDADLNINVHPLYAGIDHPINLNIGVIRSGDWPSTVPGECEIRCRVSFFPDMSRQEMHRTIETRVAEACIGDPWLEANPPVVTYDGFDTNGCEISVDDPFFRALENASLDATDLPLEPRANTAVTDQRYYIFQGVPSTCYGAEGGNAHAVDEWLDLPSMPKLARTMASLLVDWCGVA